MPFLSFVLLGNSSGRVSWAAQTRETMLVVCGSRSIRVCIERRWLKLDVEELPRLPINLTGTIRASYLDVEFFPDVFIHRLLCE